MQLQKSAIIDTQTRRLVEMTFADQSNLDQAVEILTFRIPVTLSERPRLLELQLEALQHVREVIRDEIRRLDHTLSQDHGAGPVSD
jgi:hypothetical protein